MKILHLKLNKQCFEMIASGKKKEAYRDCKAFWWSRLVEYGDYENFEVTKFRQYDAIEFMNGYWKGAPRKLVECKGITISADRKQFIIKLGEILELAENVKA